ncbi:MAG: LemA family protein [Prolixibacteraceae bacterium]|jgi:LemA protein|nr:LemA family protein [Bacteroidota bacterium]NLT00729.1 LemA family protein [Bacteroidales bacterium]OQB79143.1 MAG: LemA family protein [Bacteroidetes bacterium ADurb.Bin123]HNZ69619.1 LemA family protein [Prolixibacteraceae bacterium]HOC86881.1 LemA family protein [Prolixibacteraceae bacterium]
MGFLIIIGLVALLVFWVIGIYNRMVRLRNNRQNAFADIDVQLKQRHDLVPQLVEVVKGYAAHEKELLTKITEARSAAMGANTVNEKIVAETRLSSALQGLRVQVEAYPDLKANQNFLQLQEELSDIENKLAAARRFFNAATTEYNNSIETFPANMIAGPFGFKRETLFDLGMERGEAEKPPVIKF